MPINRATSLQRAQPYPVAEAEVVLGTASTQPLSRRLEDVILNLVFYGPTAPEVAAGWKALGKSREPQNLIIGGKPEGLYKIILVEEDIKHAIDSRIDWITLRLTLKEVGAFLWAGNYSPYEPPQNVRQSAEAGISGLSKGVLDWLKR